MLVLPIAAGVWIIEGSLGTVGGGGEGGIAELDVAPMIV
jgi:hypothetical protein